MMKFFKYLIFLFFTLFTTTAFSGTYYYFQDNPGAKFTSKQELCDSKKTSVAINAVVDGNKCSVYDNTGFTRFLDYILSGEITCAANQKKFLDGYIGAPDSFAPSTVCYQGCVYNSDGGGTAFDTPNGNLSWGINAESTGATCPTDTPKGEDTPQTNPPMKPEECKNASGSDAYCNKPSNKQCPSGYKQGSFNNQQICIKPSPDPDPTKPNPNDPNNGGGQGNCNGTNNCNTTNFDDSGIISAINSSKNAITSAISSLSNALSSGFSSVVNAVSGVTSAVNANTSAVNSNGDKVTNAVNENTSAVNAVKSAVNGLNSSIQAVTSAVNENGNKVTNAVNTNGDKVTNAVNTNGKNAVDAINANGKNTVDAVNAGTEATKENGKKLDSIKDGIDEGNGLLGGIKDTLNDIKNWLTTEQELPASQQPDIQEHEVQGYEKSYVSWSSSCPPDVQVPISLMGQSSTLVLKWSPWCELLSKLRWAIIACAYFSAAYIILGMR